MYISHASGVFFSSGFGVYVLLSLYLDLQVTTYFAYNDQGGAFCASFLSSSRCLGGEGSFQVCLG